MGELYSNLEASLLLARATVGSDFRLLLGRYLLFLVLISCALVFCPLRFREFALEVGDRS